MANSKFTTKSIGTLTLGEKLKKIRSERRISLVEAAKATHIQLKYLEHLENEEFECLPADVYVRGFLRSYAAFLGLSEQSLVRLYERERGVQKSIRKQEPKETFFRPVNFSSFIITPKAIVITFGTLLVFLGFFYLYREANIFISIPRLVVSEPLDGTTTNSKVIKVAGTSERDAEVAINGQGIVVNEEGNFAEEINLHPGSNIISVSAKNRFEKEIVKKIQVTAEFQDSGSNASGENSVSSGVNSGQGVKAELWASPNPTWVSVEADGSLVFSGVIPPEEHQTFEGKDSLKITSSKGNNTYVKINGVEKGLLSSDPGLAKDVLFTANNQ